MREIIEIECNILELESLAFNLAVKTNIGDIYMLSGDLGVGKTTFARFFINSLYKKNKLTKPENIKSPSFPILINYPILDYEIFHYDLFRIKNENELSEIGLFENFQNNISVIEWPEIIINNFKIPNYYLIKLEFVNIDKRGIKMQHFQINND